MTPQGLMAALNRGITYLTPGEIYNDEIKGICQMYNEGGSVTDINKLQKVSVKFKDDISEIVDTLLEEDELTGYSYSGTVGVFENAHSYSICNGPIKFGVEDIDNENETVMYLTDRILDMKESIGNRENYEGPGWYKFYTPDELVIGKTDTPVLDDLLIQQIMKETYDTETQTSEFEELQTLSVSELPNITESIISSPLIHISTVQVLSDNLVQFEQTELDFSAVNDIPAGETIGVYVFMSNELINRYKIKITQEDENGNIVTPDWLTTDVQQVQEEGTTYTYVHNIKIKNNFRQTLNNKPIIISFVLEVQGREYTCGTLAIRHQDAN